MAKTGVAGILVLLLLLQLAPIEELEPIPQTLQSSKNSGVDLKWTVEHLSKKRLHQHSLEYLLILW